MTAGGERHKYKTEGEQRKDRGDGKEGVKAEETARTKKVKD